MDKQLWIWVFSIFFLQSALFPDEDQRWIINKLIKTKKQNLGHSSVNPILNQNCVSVVNEKGSSQTCRRAIFRKSQLTNLNIKSTPWKRNYVIKSTTDNIFKEHDHEVVMEINALRTTDSSDSKVTESSMQISLDRNVTTTKRRVADMKRSVDSLVEADNDEPSLSKHRKPVSIH